MAMLAPSRAARSAIASPMPREAPVMNSVLPLSDIGYLIMPASTLARQEGAEGCLRFRRLQTLLEQANLFVDAGDGFIGRAAHQPPRGGNGLDGEGGDFASGLQGVGVDIARRHDRVDQAAGLGRRRAQ